jgi:uncharacterized membrane protein
MVRMRVLRALIAAAIVSGLAVFAAPPSSAQRPLQLVTPYPAVTTQAGKQVTLNIEAITPARARVDLAVVEAPTGWQAVLRGGGFEINSVFGAPTNPPATQLEVRVPADAAQGGYRVIVRGTSGGATELLQIDIKVSETAAGAVTLASDFPTLRGSGTDNFTFNVTLNNNTPEKTTFNLSAEGPRGWTVNARPSGESQAATVSVDGGGNSTIQVSADPPDDVTADKYPIKVTVAGAGKSANTEVTVEITGNTKVELTTPTGRLNTKARAGAGTNFQLVVKNDGTAPLSGVSLTSSPPTGWRVTFNPRTVRTIDAKKQEVVTARIRPAGNAVAGDYVITFSASGGGSSSTDADVRVTVQPPIWNGILFVIVLLLIAGGVYWVFQKYGRR